MKNGFNNTDRSVVLKEIILQQLKTFSLFSKVSDKELAKVVTISTVKKLKKSEIIFLEKDEYTGFYCIIEGIVKIYRVTREGKERIIHLMYNNNTFGEVPVFENYEKILKNNAKYPASAMSLCEGTRIIHIPAKPFFELMKNHYGLCMGMLSGLSAKLRIMQTQVVDVKSQDVTRRLINYILSEYNSRLSIKSRQTEIFSYNTFALSISKIDLSSYLGATLETVSRIFRRLQSENYITIKGKNITVNNYEGLKKLLNA
ncbi:MAG: Crp/Fnr family transcriptional regulator [Ignavibacteria bacterium]|nr:Crp/Fnr family transcriptional regulator [Ignavibacteria bacterium]